MDFSTFETDSFPLPDSPAVGEVYVLFVSAAEKETPFYVGQTGRFAGRMADYKDSQFAASTDFKVGCAIAYLRDEMKYEIVVRHRESGRRFEEERELIEQLREEAKQKGYKLFNDCPGYNYKQATQVEALRAVEEFCRVHYARKD
jgi:hypothetical protein